MTNENSLRCLPDDALLLRLSELLRQSRGAEAELVAHIGEVDARRLYAREADAPAGIRRLPERVATVVRTMAPTSPQPAARELCPDRVAAVPDRSAVGPLAPGRYKDRCRYVDPQGRRCTAREHLEFHHRHPYGHGGDHSVDNICLMCRAHNALIAEADYGRRGPESSSRRSGRAPAGTSSVV